MSYLRKVEMFYGRGPAGEVKTGPLAMAQEDRDRLGALKKAKKKPLPQRQAAEELGLTERHIRRLLLKLRKQGDAAVTHALPIANQRVFVYAMPSHRLRAGGWMLGTTSFT